MKQIQIQMLTFGFDEWMELRNMVAREELHTKTLMNIIELGVLWHFEKLTSP